MSRKKAKTKRKTELKIIFFIILIAAMLFIVSTYAWFSTQRNVSITNLSGTVQVAEGLEISLDALNWSNGIVLGKEDGQLDLEEDAYAGHNNLVPTEMLPASTLGLVSGTEMEGLSMLRGKLTNTKELSEIAVLDEANKSMVSGQVGFELKYPGYFAFDIFLKNSSKSNITPDILQLNYDSSLEIIEGGDATTGLQNTARIAFVKYGGTEASEGVWEGVAGVNDSQAQILDKTGAINDNQAGVYVTDVAIWEPNANDHVEYIVTNNNKITWASGDAAKYATKTLADGSKGFDLTTQMPTYGLTDASVGKEIKDIYDWSGTNSTTLKKQVVLQTTKTDATDFTIKEGVKNLISTSSTDSAKTDFVIAPYSVCRLKVYLWLEGQDVDCINYASHGVGITVNIGLVKGSTEGTHEPSPDPTPAN